MPGLSLHVVDVARGKPASGMKVEIFHKTHLIASGFLGADGTLTHSIVQTTLDIGVYEAVFHAGAFFASTSLELSDPPFLDLVPFWFSIADPARHYHLPLKITPWGFSVWRGA